MSVHIQARGFDLTEPLETYVMRRLESSLGAQHRRAGNLWVRLSDVNGPKGGADKCCRIHIALPRLRDVFVQAIQPDMYEAIDKAVRRAEQCLKRRVARPRALMLRRRLRIEQESTENVVLSV